MAESVVLLAIVIVVRVACLTVAWRMTMARERARSHGLAVVLRAAQPDSVVVSHRADGETLIICPRSTQATGAR
jgi:hypothetical protein